MATVQVVKKPSYRPWRMDDALGIIRDFQPRVRPLGYHIVLGGGVLNKGQSDKDLDLYFLPLDYGATASADARRDRLVTLLKSYWEESHGIGFSKQDPCYPPCKIFARRHTFLVEGWRIDVFVA